VKHVSTNEFFAITGSSGFIGSRLLTYLSNKSDNIRLLVRSIDASSQHEQVECDLASGHIRSDCFSGVSTVFHLAGFAHDMRTSKNVASIYQSVNVDATIRLAEIAVKAGVKKFVFVSSVKAGGSATPGVCLSENDQGDPEGIYGNTKREAELKLLEIGRKTDMNISIIRPSLVYGPNVKGNLRLMLSGVKKGWFPPLPETHNKRSMIHVDDLVRAIFLVAENNRADGEIFIATDGKSYSSHEIYVCMCKVAGKSAKKWSVPKFVFDIVAAINPKIRYKINKLLGDECYSSVKLESLGFSPQRTLIEMDRASF
jgi:UDP-glucose 4-epimerase